MCEQIMQVCMVTTKRHHMRTRGKDEIITPEAYCEKVTKTIKG